MTRMLVTGHTGLVGGAVARRLHDEGHDVVGLSRGDVPAAPYAQVSIDLGAAAAPGALIDAGPFDAVVHCAAAIGQDVPSSALAGVNRAGTEALMAAAERWDSQAFVFISSSNVIGTPGLLPVTEDHPVDPPTEYHASKLYGERVVEQAAARGRPASSLRITSPVGRGMRSDRIFAVFVARALAGDPIEVAGEGTRRQDYVHVDDVAAAVERCVEARASGLFNVASGEAVSNEELARRCVETLGSTSEVVLGSTPDAQDGVEWTMSIERARQQLGFAPRVTLDESIESVASGLR